MSIRLVNPRLTGNVVHMAVRTATTVPGDLLTSFSSGQTVAGVLLYENMRVLIKNQVDPTENGIYVVQNGLPPYRDDDMPANLDTAAATIPVISGTNGGTIWMVLGPSAIVGTDALIFQRCDTGNVLSANRGGTGTANLGGALTMLYTSTQNNVEATNSLPNAILTTDGSAVPALTTTAPSGLTLPNAKLDSCKIGDGGSFGYILTGSSLSADKTINFPATTVTQNVVLDSLSQNLTGKNLISSTFSDGGTTKKLAFDTSLVANNTTVTLAAPAVGGTIATVEYISGGAGVANWRAPVRAVTTGIIAMVASGSGVGKTLTSLVPAALSGLLGSFDGVAIGVGDRVLVTSALLGVTSPSLGIYTVTNAGSVITSFVLTRATDADTSAEMPPGTTVYVTQGNLNAGTQWSMTTYGPIVLDTTVINFQQVGASSGLTFGTGFSQSGNLITLGASATIGTSGSTAFVNSSPIAGQTLISSGAVGSAASFGAISLASSAAITGVLPIANGGTARSSYTNNAMLYGAMQQTNTAADAILTTNGASVPSFSKTLPSGLVFSGAIGLSSGAFNYNIAAGTASAACVAMLPNGAWNDTFAMLSLTQSFANKTLIAPKISGSLYDHNGLEVLEIIAGGTEHLKINAGVLGSSNHLTINPIGNLYVAKPLRLISGGFSVGLAAPALTSNITLTLPNSVGAAGQCLVSDGTGALNFADRLATDTIIITMLSGFAAASSVSYTNVAWLTWTAISAIAADLAFTILDLGAGGNIRTIDVQLVNGIGTVLATSAGISATGQYVIDFTPPTSVSLLILQVKKNLNAGANPTIAGAVINVSK